MSRREIKEEGMFMIERELRVIRILLHSLGFKLIASFCPFPMPYNIYLFSLYCFQNLSVSFLQNLNLLEKEMVFK